MSAPNAACVVAYVRVALGVGPVPGDDVSAVAVPMTLAAGDSLTVSVRKTGHEVTVKGPAVFRPCTLDEPDVILVAKGEVTTERTAPIHPGGEVFLATPAFVALVGKAAIHLKVDSASVAYGVDEGDAVITSMDMSRTVVRGDDGVVQRSVDGGVILTRCGVQVAAVVSARRMLGQLAVGGPGTQNADALGAAGSNADAFGAAGQPLLSTSIGILTAREIQHARAKVVDCAFAEAFALSCDAIAGESKQGKAIGAGCRGGYADVRVHIAEASLAPDGPPGSAPRKRSR